MYVRVKARKNKDGSVRRYAYVVRSKRRKKSRKAPKQKNVAYLGRVHVLDAVGQTLPEDQKGSIQDVLFLLFDQLLRPNGFKPLKKGVWCKETLCVDCLASKVFDQETDRNVCLEVNEGFLTGHTLKQLFPYKPPETTEKGVGQDFAQKLLAAGLKPSGDTFLWLFRKVFRNLYRK